MLGLRQDGHQLVALPLSGRGRGHGAHGEQPSKLDHNRAPCGRPFPSLADMCRTDGHHGPFLDVDVVCVAVEAALPKAFVSGVSLTLNAH